MCDVKGIYENIELLLLICSAVTVILSLIIGCIYVMYRDTRTISFKILVCISVADVLRSFALMVPFSWFKNKAVCVIVAIVGNFVITTNVTWSIYIIVLVRQFFECYPSVPELYFKTWFFIAFIVAPFYNLLPLITDSYGLNEGVCTYRNDLGGNIWRAIQELSCIAFTILALVLYLHTFLKLKHLKILTWAEMFFEKGLIYSIIFLISLCTILIYRLTENFLGFCNYYGLAYLSYSMIALQGFLNFIAILMNKNFRPYIRSFFLCKRIPKEEFVSYDDLLD